MAEQYTLAAERRDDHGTRQARRLRRAGKLPAVVYGLGEDPVAVVVEGSALTKLLKSGGHNALINIEVGGASQLTIARALQRHPVRGELLHVDFVRIRADQEIEASVPVHLVGEPAGAKEGGVLEHVLFEVVIRAKPADLPQALELDVSALGVGDNLKAEDMALPPGVEMVTEADRVVANMMAPRLGAEEALAGLTPEQLAELEGLSEDELQALRALASAAAPEAAGEEAAEGAGEEAGGEAEGSAEAEEA